MNIEIIPEDSLLRFWCKALAITEIPLSYQIAGGITLIGALLKRQVWVDQQNWKVYPNQSVLFVGDSGIGKDTIINFVLKDIQTLGSIPVLGGKTMEGMEARMLHLGSPAACYIPAGELSSFFGNRDYQSGMIQEFTDLLSTGEKKDVTTKTGLLNGGPAYIYQPTITLHGGSTEEWLHKAMPDGTMEGGFLGRFLIVVEYIGTKFRPLIKHDITHEERDAVKDARERWIEGLKEIVRKCKKPGEMYLFEEARNYYANWYYNRFRYFSKAVLPYANRSRDMVLRLGMLMALSRGHWNWIDEEDIKFGTAILMEVAQRIDKVLLPPSIEGQAAQAILRMLPATPVELWKALGRKFNNRILEQAEQMLLKSNQIKKERGVYFAN